MNLSSKLDPVLEEIIARWGIPGLGVGIIENDEIVYARGKAWEPAHPSQPIRSFAWPPLPSVLLPQPSCN